MSNQIKFSFICLALVVTQGYSQEIPQVTKERAELVNKLIDACIKEGGLKAVKGMDRRRPTLVVADRKKIRDTLMARKEALGDASRDAFLSFLFRVPSGSRAAITQFLAEQGQIKGDNLALGLASFFTAFQAQHEGRLKAAISNYQEAIRLFAKSGAKEWLAMSLNNIGSVLESRGSLEEAEGYFKQALQMLWKLCPKEKYPQGHSNLADTLINMGSVLQSRGSLEEAEGYYKQALQMRRKLYPKEKFPQGHSNLATSLNNMGSVLESRGSLEEAEGYFKQALQMKRKLYPKEKFPQGHADLARGLSNMGSVLESRGSLEEAEGYFKQALQMFRKLYPKEKFPQGHSNLATSLNNMGSVLESRGSLEEAEGYYKQALQMRRKLYPIKKYPQGHSELAGSLNNMGSVLESRGSLEEAEGYFKQALQMLWKLYPKETYPQGHSELAGSLNNMGSVLESRGSLEEAEGYFKQALQMFRKLYPKEKFPQGHSNLATSLNNMGNFLKSRGSLEEAEGYYKQALQALCLSDSELDFSQGAKLIGLLKPIPLSAKVLHVRISVLERMHPNPSPSRLREIEQAYALTGLMYERHKAEILSRDQDKVSQGEKADRLVPRWVGILRQLHLAEGKITHLNKSLGVIEGSRARVHLESVGKANAARLAKLPSELYRKERSYVLRIREIDARIAHLQDKPGDEPAREVRRLYAERMKLEEEEKEFIESLRKSHPQYAGFRYPKPCSVEEARSCLNDNEVALLFTLGEEASYVFVLQKKPAKGDQSQGMSIIKLPGRETINAHVATLLSNNVLQSNSLSRDRSALLYDLVLKPIARQIANRDLLIVPDGSLELIPFEMLVEGQTDEEDGHWLVEKHRVRYAPSLSALHLSRQASASRKKDQTRPLFAVADPIFHKDDPRLNGKVKPVPETQVTLAGSRYSWLRGGKHFGRLPNSGLEARSICKELGVSATATLFAGDATETNIKKLSEQGDLRKARYLHFATHGIVGTAQGQPPALVLTRVSNDNNDEKEQLGGPNEGYLTLPEVTFLDLNADLVVLSACETAKGRRARGEGVSGLARAFLYAGTKGVVCSLWSVDDARTARLMASMYSHLKKGQSSPDALRAAQLEMIKQEMAPFFWAPFVTIGE